MRKETIRNVLHAQRITLYNRIVQSRFQSSIIHWARRKKCRIVPEGPVVHAVPPADKPLCRILHCTVTTNVIIFVRTGSVHSALRDCECPNKLIKRSHEPSLDAAVTAGCCRTVLHLAQHSQVARDFAHVDVVARGAGIVL